ncbi:MAG: DUF2752 domain-containing protein [Bacteroidales bacterium]|nr:DUF2752 domain-containing protein [Bacteroidales bacterium]
MIIDIERYMLPCPVKQVTGLPCPGCGMQRAIIELVKGNIIDSIISYPALIPLIIMFCFLILHLKFEFKYGATILKYFFIINAIIISINYIFEFI